MLICMNRIDATFSNLIMHFNYVKYYIKQLENSFKKKVFINYHHIKFILFFIYCFFLTAIHIYLSYLSVLLCVFIFTFYILFGIF